MRRDHELHHLHAHALARQLVEAVAARDAGGKTLGVRMIAGAVGGMEAEEAQDAQIIFRDALARVADEAHAARRKIVKAADIVIDRAVARQPTAH